MLKLYEGWTSSASWRVRWGLALKGLAYDSVLVDVAAGEHHVVVAGVNPLHAVPTLQLEDGRAIVESVAILEWLEETRPAPPLLPGDALARARVRSLVELVNSGIHPLQNTAVRRAVSDDPEVQRAWAARWIVRGLTAYESHLAGMRGRYSVGDTITMADLFVVPQVRNAERFGADISSCPRVLAVYEACMETPEARATDPRQVEKRRRG